MAARPASHMLRTLTPRHNDGCWLGATDGVEEGTWVNVDGTPYTQVGTVDNNNGNEHCQAMSNTGSVDDVQCSLSKASFCYIPASVDAFCDNGVQDDATEEEGVDCGGMCGESCPTSPKPFFHGPRGGDASLAVSSPFHFTAVFSQPVAGVKASSFTVMAGIGHERSISSSITADGLGVFYTEAFGSDGLGNAATITNVTATGSEPATTWVIEVTMADPELASSVTISMDAAKQGVSPANLAADSITVAYNPDEDDDVCLGWIASRRCDLGVSASGCNKLFSRCNCLPGYFGRFCDQECPIRYGYFVATLGARQVCAKRAGRKGTADNVEERCAPSYAGFAASLVSLHAVNERESVHAVMLREPSVWIGAQDSYTEGLFEWTDGTPMDYTGFWGSGEPDNHGDAGASAPVNTCDRCWLLYCRVSCCSMSQARAVLGWRTPPEGKTFIVPES